MSFSTRVSSLALACLFRACGADCPALSQGQTISFAMSPEQSFCFIADLTENQGSRISVTQPVNFALRLLSPEKVILFDGFEFGPETATLIVPGRYRFEVISVNKERIPPVTVLMSRTPVSLQEAGNIRRAEEQASLSEKTLKREDTEQSLRLWESLNDKAAIARTRLKLGDVAYNAGELSEAREHYEYALSLCAPASDTRCMAEAENNSGLVSQRLGDFDASLMRLNSAARDWKLLSETKLAGVTLSNLGLLFRQTSDYQQAIGLYEQAGRTLAPLDPLAHAKVLNNLGLCYQSLAEFGKARNFFERAIAAESSLAAGKKDALQARINLGRNFFLVGDRYTARVLLNAALREAAALKDRPDLATVRNNLGQVLLTFNRPAEARENLEIALSLHESVGDRRLIASDLHYLGVAATSAGQIDSARELFVRAVRIRLECLLRDAAADSLYALADLERSAGNLSSAREYAEQALTLLESIRIHVPGATLRASFYSQKRRFIDLLLGMATLPDNPSAAEDGLLLAERGRGRALLDLLAEGSVPDLLPSDVLRRRLDLQRRIDFVSTRLTVATGSQEQALRDRAEELIAEDEDIEAAVRQSLASQQLGEPLESVQKLRRELLPPDSALLEFHLGQQESYLWLVAPALIRVFRLPPRPIVEAQIRRTVELFGDILGRRRSPAKQAAFESALRIVSRTLLGQLTKTQLPDQLIIVPDGDLNRLPFAALRLPGARGALGQVFDLVQIPAAGFLDAGRKPRKISEFPASLLAIADPVFSSRDPRVVRTAGAHSPLVETDLPRLPFSAEIDEAARLIPPSRRQTLRGFNATPARLRQISLKDFAVVEFSTHAIVDDRIPELSRIALSLVDRAGKPVDGVLRPWQLSEFHLDGSTVVLSACGTGLGKGVLGEGMAGFTAGLFHAGAAQIVLTLAEVDAEGSSEFLRSAYRNFFQSGDMTMARALTLARRDLSGSRRWSDPYYWASFVLFGRPVASLGASPL